MAAVAGTRSEERRVVTGVQTCALPISKKTGRALALTSALVAAVSLSVAPSTAEAAWHGGGGWHEIGRAACSDWSADVCSSDLEENRSGAGADERPGRRGLAKRRTEHRGSGLAWRRWLA